MASLGHGLVSDVETLPALRPTCPSNPQEHGFLQLRTNPDTLAAWCGTWYDCASARCTSSVLWPSPALSEQLRRQANATERPPG